MERTLGRVRVASLAAAFVLATASAAAFHPRWSAGRVIDAAGAAWLYGHRQPAPISNRIVLVEVDDASVYELGPWPWDGPVIRKIFDAPFASAALVVPLVSPEDFVFDKESEDEFWRGLSGANTVSILFPFEPALPDVDVAAILGNHPAGDQGQLVRAADIKYETINSRLPAWRREVITSLAFNYLKRNPKADLSDFLARVLDPYWRNSTELEKVAEFAYTRARLTADLASAGLDPKAALVAGVVPEMDDVYAQPAAGRARAVGFVGVDGSRRPYEAAIAASNGRWFLRVPFVAAGAVPGAGEPEIGDGAISIRQSDGSVWSTRITDAASFLPDWTGNGETQWNAGFWRYSAATLVEAVNARRALWEGFIRYEKSKGQNTVAPLVEEYDRAVAARDSEAAGRLYRQVRNRTNELKDALGFSDAAGEDSPSSRGIGTIAGEIMSLEYDYQVHAAQMADAFDGKIVAIVPAAEQFSYTLTPWGRRVPAAAVEVAVLNSILQGRSIKPAPALVWWGLAVTGGLAAAGLAARFGAVRSLAPCTILAVAAGSGWFLLFASRGVFLGASCLASLPVCFTAGSIVYAAGEGRARRRMRRLLAGRLSGPAAGASLKRSGCDVLREVRDAAALTVIFAGGPGLTQAAARRLSRAMAEAAFAVDGIVLDAAGDVEAAFGWLRKGNELDSALSAALSARNRMKPVMEKLAAEGGVRVTLHVGIAAGPGRIAEGNVSREVPRPAGEVFDWSRGAAAIARAWGATIVANAADAEALRSVAELRRLDPAGQFVEVLERKGALAVTAEKVRVLYESALDDLAAGRPEAALRSLEKAVAANGDEPSNALIEYIRSQRAPGSR